ncbi:hypothetical protein G6O67_005246 [Ophiocordyceps sinensis]|uniref:DNase1 protein n=2 Tax=Ophiocordyceps sinensis TaxID=72228 RepID=A0A8H4V601_9HYPO|nr:DNase1 protein [Ophiocordyceps sinensis CO18]KAF4508925.1 hypothetical protein G6O67_005246 [Ophiocordyceps sinensis]
MKGLTKYYALVAVLDALVSARLHHRHDRHSGASPAVQRRALGDDKSGIEFIFEEHSEDGINRINNDEAIKGLDNGTYVVVTSDETPSTTTRTETPDAVHEPTEPPLEEPPQHVKEQTQEVDEQTQKEQTQTQKEQTQTQKEQTQKKQTQKVDEQTQQEQTQPVNEQTQPVNEQTQQPQPQPKEQHASITFWTLDDVQRTIYFVGNPGASEMAPVVVDRQENKTVKFAYNWEGNFYAIQYGWANKPGMLGEVQFAGWLNKTYFDVSAIVNGTDINNVKQMWPMIGQRPMSGCEKFPCDNCYRLPDDRQTKVTDENHLMTTLGSGSPGINFD